MLSTILLFAALSTAVTAHVGRRHPYGIYPSPSITASLNSSSLLISSIGYPTAVSSINTTSSDAPLSTETSTPTSNLTTSTTPVTILTSTITGPPLTWTTSNGTFVLGSSTTLMASSTPAAGNDTAAGSTSTSAVLPRATCASITIGDVTARGACGCNYNIHTCLERLSNLSEWSNSQTTESFNGCMGACDSEPNCFSFTWQTSNGVCRMFGGMLNGGAGVVSDADFISGEVVKGSCTGSCSG
ncbi:hypothetical protein D6D21_03344 [Aureobasidium pullulans]|uniref:Apple domain-containing protein n=1 Tax=Aureobasidium pullulans TaxID=5580 RepID=A0AB74J364_AURPU|nr:hypothetical protein D6D21_03344 [Aureobasidium pullulans]